MNLAGLNVRLADLGDPLDGHRYLDLLNAYARDPMGANTPLPMQLLQRTLADLRNLPTSRIFVAELGDETVGFATCFLGYSTFRARPLLNIHDIAVLPKYRGQGYGRRLLQAIAEQAQREGCCKLTLEVREDNPLAAGLYHSEGFSAGKAGDKQVQYRFLEKRLQ